MIFTVYISIALTVVGLTQVFPYAVDVSGINTTDLLNSIQEYENTIKSLTESGNIVEYTVAVGYIAWEGMKIIVSVLMFVLGEFLHCPYMAFKRSVFCAKASTVVIYPLLYYI